VLSLETTDLIARGQKVMAEAQDLAGLLRRTRDRLVCLCRDVAAGKYSRGRDAAPPAAGAGTA
jgi:hypothetical protein